jgi:hypothetical protein
MELVVLEIQAVLEQHLLLVLRVEFQKVLLVLVVEVVQEQLQPEAPHLFLEVEALQQVQQVHPRRAQVLMVVAVVVV